MQRLGRHFLVKKNMSEGGGRGGALYDTEEIFPMSLGPKFRFMFRRILLGIPRNI